MSKLDRWIEESRIDFGFVTSVLFDIIQIYCYCNIGIIRVLVKIVFHRRTTAQAELGVDFAFRAYKTGKFTAGGGVTGSEYPITVKTKGGALR